MYCGKQDGIAWTYSFFPLLKITSAVSIDSTNYLFDWAPQADPDMLYAVPVSTFTLFKGASRAPKYVPIGRYVSIITQISLAQA